MCISMSGQRSGKGVRSDGLRMVPKRFTVPRERKFLLRDKIRTMFLEVKGDHRTTAVLQTTRRSKSFSSDRTTSDKRVNPC